MTTLMRPARRAGLYEDMFWRYLQTRKVHLQSCNACGSTWYPPGPVCPGCLSDAWSWKPISGAGKAVAWTTFHRQYFKEVPVPHTVVSAKLDEGPLFVADFSGDVAALALDTPLHLQFVQVQHADSISWSVQWTPRP